MRNLTFADALKMQKILKKSGIFKEIQEDFKKIDASNNTQYGYEIISLFANAIIEKFDIIEDEFVDFIEDIHNIKNFKELELSEALNLIIELKDNKSFQSFFSSLAKKTK